MGLFGDADLVVTRDVAYSRTLKYQITAGTFVDWSLYNLKAQARDRQGGLVFDLTPFFSVSGDPTVLIFSMGAAFTYALPREARWDLLATLKTDANQVFRTPMPAGRVLLLPGITSRV